jgi:hypothetical protein
VFFIELKTNDDKIMMDNYKQDLENKNIFLPINTNEFFFSEELLKNDMELIFNNPECKSFSELLCIDEIYQKTGVQISKIDNDIDHSDKNKLLIVFDNGNVHQIKNEEEKQALIQSNIRSNNFDLLKYQGSMLH